MNVYKVPLVLTPQADGGYVVTSPLLPELITEGGTVAEALTNAKDALAATIELYEDTARELPSSLKIDATGSPFLVEEIITAA